jgi:uncharacterized protein YndB with AHSA1/START domain
MSGTFERTFSVSVSIDRAWRACTDPDELAQWFFEPRGVRDGGGFGQNARPITRTGGTRVRVTEVPFWDTDTRVRMPGR